MNTVLPYADRFSMSGTTLSPVFGTEQAYRLNSLYDPDFTNIGHQPYGFDQVIPFYARYIVTHCDINITFSDPSSDGVYVGVFIKSLNDPATLVNASIGQAMERPNVFCQPLNNTGSQRITFKKSVSIGNLHGLTDQEYLNAWPTTGALISANPANVPYLMFAVADSNSASTPATCKVTIELKFKCIFSERLMPAQS